MTIEALILEKMRMLPPDKQREVADFVELLARQTAASVRRRRLRGLCEDLGAQISAEDIDQVRREMWGVFPREDI